MKLRTMIVALSAGLSATSGLASAQSTELVSVDPGGGVVVNGAISLQPAAMSADGRYVGFVSDASNLVAGDTNNRLDVFVYDRQTGTTERVSVDSAGVQGNEGSTWPSLSADGRFVAFSGLASNLVPGDTNGEPDVFVHDRQTGTTELVSVDPTGAVGNGQSGAASISADGRFVAFHSATSNLVAGDTNPEYDAFVRDRQSGTTERVSVSSSGLQANGGSWMPFISSDGRFVAFGSLASNLVAGDTNGTRDIFVHDRLSGTTERVSVSSSGAQGNHSSYGGDPHLIPAISADGRFVAFCSLASNLVAGDTNGVIDMFVHDRISGTTQRVSVDSAGVQGNAMSRGASISADGRYVGFDSIATNLVTGDTNGHRDVFLHDRLSGTTERVSVDTGGQQGNDDSDMPSVSPDGRLIVFGSRSPFGADTDGAFDVFLRDRGAPGPVSFCAPGQAGTIVCPCSNPPLGTLRGCDNSQGTGGASLIATGSASLAADTLHLTTGAERTNAESVVLQGTAALIPDVTFGMGVRCVGGSLKRLYVETASGGSIGVPNAIQPSISSRSAALGDTIQAGEHRYYQVYYRDPFVLGGCPAASTFNATNAVDVPWSP